MAFIQPLNLYYNIEGLFAGSEAIFIMIAVLVVLYIAAKRSMSLLAALPMVAFVILALINEGGLYSASPLQYMIGIIMAFALTAVVIKVVDK